MKNVLVTGATGFIGSYVIEELLKNDCSVIASSINEKKAKQKSWYHRAIYIPFNLTQFDSATNYYDFFGKPDLMIHLAWEGLPNYKSFFHVEENLPRHLSLLKNLIQHGLSNLTVAGTCFEYGMQEGCLKEDMLALPTNPYAIAKDALRKSLEELIQLHPLLLKWVRLFYMYGKGQNPNSLLSQLEKAVANKEKVFNMSGGEQIRDFLPVEKVAEYIIKIALQNSVTGIINCCSGVPITVKQLAMNYLVEKNASMHLNLGYYPYTSYEPMAFWGDNEKLKGILDTGNSVNLQYKL